MINFGLSTKKDGSMRGNFLKQKNYLNSLIREKKIIVSANLVHGTRVVRVDDICSEQTISNCDALTTNDKRKILCLTVADCLPLYLYDQKQEIIALVHGGWRGIEAGIIKEVINSFKQNYQSRPEDIKVQIGPHIKACHFEVQTDVALKFKNNGIIKRDSKSYLDLAVVAIAQLIESGVLLKNIIISEECTFCSQDKYFSYRRDKPAKLETMLAYLNFK